jgi:hypothetical protein
MKNFVKFMLPFPRANRYYRSLVSPSPVGVGESAEVGFVALTSPVSAILIVALVSSALVPCAKAGQVMPNLITNGGFETGGFSGWTVSGNADGESLVTDFTTKTYYAHSGSYYAMLGSFGSLSDLSQTVATVPNSYYALSYYLASDGGDPSQFIVTENGAQLADLTDLPKSGYVEYTEDFFASSAQTTISFASRDDPGYLLLDDVSLVDPPSPAVPLPSTGVAAGVMLGVAGSFGLWRWRKQSIEPAV